MKVTFFTIPKPFIGHTGVIQKNAIQSWKDIDGSEVLLFGNEEGIGQESVTIGAHHFPHVSLSKYGTPYLDEVFKIAQTVAKNDYLCYVNADIILYPDIIDTLEEIPFTQFLMTGQRWDVNVDVPIHQDSVSFLKYITEHHTLQSFPGMDYFAFPKGMLTDFPQFIVGRRGWDNWLVYHCRKREIPVIDATGAVTAVHQNHDYNHVPETKGSRWEKCPESDYNLSLVGNRTVYLWELDDATHDFFGGKLSKKPFTLRTATQGLILKTPERYHRVINPFYRAGHLVKWGIRRVFK